MQQQKLHACLLQRINEQKLHVRYKLKIQPLDSATLPLLIMLGLYMISRVL